MHNLEPFYNWKDHYDSEQDPASPYFQKDYDQFEFTTEIYGYYIHPQWDSIGSQTLFLKVLYADYEDGYAVIELIGEWNDCLYNDIMYLKRDLLDLMMAQGINKFILIGENVLNFHYSDDSYYEELFDDVTESDGWIALLNFQGHVLDELQQADIDQYFILGGKLNDLSWRSNTPEKVCEKVQMFVQKRLEIRP
jgi:hypothetical protein